MLEEKRLLEETIIVENVQEEESSKENDIFVDAPIVIYAGEGKNKMQVKVREGPQGFKNYPQGHLLPFHKGLKRILKRVDSRNSLKY